MSDNQDNNEQYNEKVLRQQEAIRASGMINMFDKAGVKRIAEEMGSDELAEFIEQADSADYIEMADEASQRFR
jgi:hypothetical protein